MSLDVYVKYKKKGLIKYNNPSHSEEEDTWWANITHNMGEMAEAVPISTIDGSKATLYDYVWRPEEQEEKVDTTVMNRVLSEGICYMISHRKDLLKFNPENGWGNYDSFLKWLIDYKNVCEDHPGCNVSVSR